MDLSVLGSPSAVGLILTLVMVGLFDTAGTLLGLSTVAAEEGGRFEMDRMTHAFMADAVGTSTAAVFGSSSTTTYLESAAGIGDGGRTGLMAVTVGLFFFVSLFFWPLAAAVPVYATAPALILIGCFMMKTVAKIPWPELREALPAFLVVLIIPLSFSIANGVGFGIVSFVLLSFFTGEWRRVHWSLYLLASVLVASIWI